MATKYWNTRSDSQARPTSATGSITDELPLGVAADVAFGAPRRVHFEPSDTLVLATDDSSSGPMTRENNTVSRGWRHSWRATGMRPLQASLRHCTLTSSRTPAANCNPTI